MNNDNKIEPQYRFPEFKKDRSWDVDVVKNLIKTITPPKKLNSNEYLKEGDYPIVDQSKSFYCGYSNDKEALISPENDLIVFGDHTCITKYINHPFIQGADGIKIFSTKKSVLPNYFYQYLQYNPVKQEEYKRHFSILKEKVISYPTNPAEQQKIATCLSNLDDVIAGHEEKLKALEEHKKGLMQNLFPQEGETQPKYRFPEYENDGDWVETKLGDVTYYTNGRAHEQDIDVNGKFVVVNSKFISSDGNVIKYSNASNCLASENDILMVLSDVPNGKAIAKCYLVKIDDKYTVNQRVCKLTPKSDVDSRILYYLTNRNKYFLGFDDGVKQTNLRNEDVLNFVFLLPVKIQEQQKIASVLSSVDELIVAQREKIEALKEHKKGLMQGLFPKLEA